MRPLRRRGPSAARPRVEGLEGRSLLATFTVTLAADSGPGTLRQAILDANASPGADAIAFNIGTGVQAIRPLSALPIIAAGQPLSLDGSTQPGGGAGTRIVLDGSRAGVAVVGLQVDADNSVIRGLTVCNFGGAGVVVHGGGSQVAGCVVGADPSGLTAQPNAAGISVTGPRNLIGGPSAAEGNLVSGNRGNGIDIAGAGASGNTVAGNYVGLAVDGATALANGGRGVSISGGATGNTVGGGTAAARNVVSGNGGEGIGITGAGTAGNLVGANNVGTDADGAHAVPNAGAGVGLSLGATGNVVGAATAGGGNLISGNGGAGVGLTGPGTAGNFVQNNLIGLSASGGSTIPNFDGVAIYGGASGNTVGLGTPFGRNVISGNTYDGVAIIDGATAGNVVQNNYIGLDPTGTVARGNLLWGIDVFTGASNNTIGGPLGSLGNLVSGNLKEGIRLNSAGAGNAILGNMVGLGRGGADTVPNGTGGVSIYATPGPVVGGGAGLGNVISGNNGPGLLVSASPRASILGNIVGLDISGTTAIGNLGSGIVLDQGSNDAAIGSMRAPNVVSGNAETGILIRLSARATLIGNKVGTDLAGVGPRSNAGRPGVPAYGVALVDSPSATIGPGNVISGNGKGGGGGGGVSVSGASPGVSILQDTIGYSPLPGRMMANGGPGVLVVAPATALDGDYAGVVQANTVADNDGAGVAFVGRGILRVVANNIRGNLGPGIDLGNDGPTPNDPLDADNGPNGLINFPVLTAALGGTGHVVVAGSVDTTPNTPGYTLSFYASPTRSASGLGQGSRYLGDRLVGAVGPSGHLDFTETLPAVAPGQYVSATLADAAGRTSEFSADLGVTAAPGSLGASTFGDFDGDGRADLAVYRPTTAQWLIQQSAAGPRLAAFGAPGVDIPLVGDFDGDGKADLAVYRPATAQWLIQLSGGGTRVATFGAANLDIPVPADYDGDGKTDLAVYRPTTGQWFLLQSTAGPRAVDFGGPGLDQPVLGDFDGDGKADIALYRRGTGQWLILGSTAGPRLVAFGAPGLDVPVPADFDGDGRTDLAVYRPTTGQWLIRRSTAGPEVVQFGVPGLDQPVPADYDGDGRADLAVYRRGTGQWLILRSTDGPIVAPFGQPDLDVPIPSPLAYRYAGGLRASGFREVPPATISTSTTAVAPVRRVKSTPTHPRPGRAFVASGHRPGAKKICS